MIQKTLGIIKPNATAEKFTGQILADVEKSGLTLVDIKMLTLSREVAEEFYAEHKEKDFFVNLIDFMTSNEVVVFSMKGENAVTKYRALMGATDPKEAEVGTLRHKYAKEKSKNSVHGSDSLESAERELKIFGFETK